MFSEFKEKLREHGIKEGSSFSHIKKKDFVPLQRRRSQKPLIFIDGGNNELYSSPTLSLSFLRAAAITFTSNSRRHIENIQSPLIVESKISEKKRLCFSAKFKAFPELDFNIAIDDASIKENGKVPSISKIALIARRLLELKLAEKIADDVEQSSIMIMDGSLENGTDIERKIFSTIKKRCEEKNILLSSLVKTNRIISQEGLDLIRLLSISSPGGEWFIKGSDLEEDKEIKGIKRIFVKLNRKSEHIFRFEIIQEQAGNVDLSKILGILVSNSNDPMFLGYPYGLILADKHGKVGNIEKEYLLTKLKTELGDDNRKMDNLRSSIDSHSYIDRINN